MAKLTKEEIFSKFKVIIGENESDEVLGFMEDLQDTVNDYEDKIKGDGTDWKAKYEENDASWRKRYKDRFFSSDENPDPNLDPEPDDNKDKPLTFEELFKNEN